MFIDDRGRSPRRSVGRWLATIAGIGVLLVVIVLVLLWWYAGSRLVPVAVAALDEAPSADPSAAAPEDGEAAPTGQGPTDVLVVTTDSTQVGDGGQNGPAVESILLVQPRPSAPVVVSFPMDLRVTYPGEGAVRLGDVLAMGGPDGLVRTLQDFTGGVDLDHYVSVDLAGASSLADALDGVEVCLDQPFADPEVGLDLAAGCRALGPDQAAAFVRSGADSEEFGSAAFARDARRLRFVASAAAEMSGVTSLANPLRVKRVVDATAEHVQTDRDLGLRSLRDVASAVGGVDAGDVQLRTVPGTVQTIEGETYVVSAPEQATAMFDVLARGGQLDAQVGTEVASELGPANVDVLVVNGVGINGLAGDAQSYLEQREFRVIDAVNPGDIDASASFDPTLRRLTVRHTTSTLPHAEVLQGHLGGVPVRLQEADADSLPRDADVVLVVGSAWNDRG